MTISTDTMVEERPGSPLLSLTRGQETELPASAKIRFISGEDDYRQAVAEAEALVGRERTCGASRFADRSRRRVVGGDCRDVAV